MWLIIFISTIIGLLIGATIGKVRSSGGKDAVLNWSIYGVLIGAAVGFLVGGSAGAGADYENIPLVVTAEQFEQQVLRAERPVMVDFYATQCPACKILAPTIGALASEYKDTVDVVKVNVDKSPDLAMRYNIEGTPTTIFFKNGIPAVIRVGVHGIEDYRAIIHKLIQH